jgi:predicted transcriptional regulator
LSAYLANNTVPSEDLAGLIRSTRDALTQEAETLEQEEPETFTPAISVRKSLASSDHIISLNNGKPYKTLKRHLMGHGLTPESYRSRYNLPANYPTVAPVYAEHRRDIARKAGLGSRKPAVEVAPLSEVDAPSGASFDGTEATTSQSMPQDIAETAPSAGEKKSKAPSKLKAFAVEYPVFDQVAPTLDADEAPAAEQETPSAVPTPQSSEGEPTLEASKSKAASPAKKPRVKASSAKSSKGRAGKPKDELTDEPALSSQTSSDGSGELFGQQNTQAAAPEREQRAKRDCSETLRLNLSSRPAALLPRVPRARLRTRSQQVVSL